MAQRLSSYRIREAPRSYRVVPAMEYLRNFASDRSHMRRKDIQGRDEWLATPPPYPPIVNDSGHPNTFSYYRDFKSEDCQVNPVFGRIIDESTFLRKFARHNDGDVTGRPSVVQSKVYQGQQSHPPEATGQGEYECKFWPLANPDSAVLPRLNLQGEPQLTPPENGVIKLRSDGQYVVLVCPNCKIDCFLDPWHFNEHCRSVHNKVFNNDNERDMACGKAVQRGPDGWVFMQDQDPPNTSEVEMGVRAFTMSDIPSLDDSLRQMKETLDAVAVQAQELEDENTRPGYSYDSMKGGNWRYSW